MKVVADTLGVARSNLAEQAQKHFIGSQATGMARTRAGDNEVLPAIQRLVTERPSYGYRRITQLLRRKGIKVNAKRVARLRRQEGLKVTRKQRRMKRLGLSTAKRQRIPGTSGVGTSYMTKPRTEAASESSRS